MAKVCEKCGEAADVLYGGGYCNDCYGEIWDRGFSATSEWAEHLEHTSLTSKLDKGYDEDPAEFERIVLKILEDFNLDKWYCTRCKAVRLSKEEQIDVDTGNCLKELLKPCHKCNAKGYLDHEG